MRGYRLRGEWFAMSREQIVDLVAGCGGEQVSVEIKRGPVATRAMFEASLRRHMALLSPETLAAVSRATGPECSVDELIERLWHLTVAGVFD